MSVTESQRMGYKPQAVVEFGVIYLAIKMDAVCFHPHSHVPPHSRGR